MNHVGDVKGKIKMAKETLFMADEYMGKLGHELARLNEKKLGYEQVESFVNELLPLAKDATEIMNLGLTLHRKGWIQNCSEQRIRKCMIDMLRKAVADGLW